MTFNRIQLMILRFSRFCDVEIYLKTRSVTAVTNGPEGYEAISLNIYISLVILVKMLTELNKI